MSDVEDPVRVVHVDDDAEIVDLAGTFLSRADDRLAVTPARSGRDALDLLADEQIHCVLTDYHLPDMDCEAFATAVREQAPGMPIVLFTGRDRPRIEDALLDRLTAYLQKGSGVEQYTKLAETILAAVADESVETDGGRDYLDRFLDAVDASDRERVLGDTLAAIESGLLLFDTDGQLVSWNRSVPVLTGYDDDELAAMTPRDLFAADHSETVDTVLTDASEGDSTAIETRLDHRTGTELPVTLRCTGLTDREGTPVGVAGVVRDISDRVAAENARDREQERLEEFVGAVSHDLRNPLNVLAGRLELARRADGDEHFDALDRATRQIEGLIDDLVALARMGHPVAETSPVALGGLTQKTWNGLDTAAGTLAVETDRTISADQERLSALLEALLENAVVHGGDDVSVTVGTTEAGFFVADDGPGIPAEDRERLLEYGETTIQSGAGLGLALARRTAQAHGWSLSITESESGGTRVEITGVDT